MKKRSSIKATLEYCKYILHRVSFDSNLFEKELRKAIRSLLPEEILQLRDWCYDQFGKVYAQILNRYFLVVAP